MLTEVIQEVSWITKSSPFALFLLTSINYVWIEMSPFVIGRPGERKGNDNITDLKHLKDPDLFFLKYRNYPSSMNHVPTLLK